MPKKTEHVILRCTPWIKEALRSLANRQTAGNVSALICDLVRREHAKATGENPAPGQ